MIDVDDDDEFLNQKSEETRRVRILKGKRRLEVDEYLKIRILKGKRRLGY